MNEAAPNEGRTYDTRLWVSDKKTGTLPLRYPAHGDCWWKLLYVVIENHTWFQPGLVFMLDRLGDPTFNPWYNIDQTQIQL